MRGYLHTCRRLPFAGRLGLTLLAAGAFAPPAAAQVVIPHGDFDGGFETWLVAAVSFALLCLAMWCYFRGRE